MSSTEYPYEQPRPENVVQLDVDTTGEISVENILRAAYKCGLDSLICVGQKDGKLYVMNTDPDMGDMIFVLSRVIHQFQKLLDEREVLMLPGHEDEESNGPA
jgi:hypothetical protein